MSGWSVEFVNTRALAEVEALPVGLHAKLTRLLETIERYGFKALVMPQARPVQGKLWELRISDREGIARSLYVAASGRRVLVLRTFVKKTRATPLEEIRLALQRLKEVES